MNNQKKLYTVAEAATTLGLGRSLVYILISSGELKSISIGRARRIPVEAIDEFIKQRIALKESGVGVQH